MNGSFLIAQERNRQLQREGYSQGHDDAHVDGEITWAAVAYVLCTDPFKADWQMYWPWEAAMWKPSPDRKRNLVKAGALIAAEIDRLLRLEEK